MLSRDERAWKFERGIWSEFQEGVFARLRRKEVGDLPGALRSAGYVAEPVIKLGNVDQWGFAVEVYSAAPGQAPDYPYYALVNLGPDVECIYITDFPSVIMFMSQVGSIVGELGKL